MPVVGEIEDDPAFCIRWEQFQCVRGKTKHEGVVVMESSEDGSVLEVLQLYLR